MSRYGYCVEGYENVSVLGWDPGLETYFAQISANNNIDPNDRPTKLHVGAKYRECLTVEDLDRYLKNAGLPGVLIHEHPYTNANLWDLLRNDKKNNI